jgi:hypothetical protein
MRRFMTESRDDPESATLANGIAIMQAYVGISLIALGVLLLGVAVRTVMQL